MSEGIGYGAGEFHWQLILCLILAWIVIFVALIKGIKSSGKVIIQNSLSQSERLC